MAGSDSRYIRVIWNCGMGEKCTNVNEPGIHRGDDGYEKAHDCVRQEEPAAKKKLKQK